MSSFQGGSMRPFVRRDKSAVCGPLLPNSDAEPNVIIRKFTLQKGKFCSEAEDRSVSAIAVTSQIVSDEGKKAIDTNETVPSNVFNQRSIAFKKLESSQSAVVESGKMQEKTEGHLRSIANPQVCKTLPVLLSKNTRLGMVGGKLVILHPMQGTQPPFITKKPNPTVYKKMKLTSSDDPHQSDADGIQSSSAVKPSTLSSNEVTRDIKKSSAGLAMQPKHTKTEVVLASSGKESPAKPCQFKLETSSSSPKGCFILPFTNRNHSNNGEVVKLSTSPQNEVKVITTTAGNKVLVKKSVEGEVGTSAEPVLTNSTQKKTVVLTSGLKPRQPILKLADVPGNCAGAKTFMLATNNNNSGEKTNGKIKYVALPGHMLPKLLPGTKVYTAAAVSQKNVAATGVPTSTADNNKVVATTVPAPEVLPVAVAPAATVQQPSAPKVPPVTPNQTPANTIELKVEVDQKGDVVGVTPAKQPANEQVDTEKAKGTTGHGSWALLQKRCNQAMELKRKVLQKERCQSRVRKIPQKTVTEIDRGTQTSFFSLVEPGRLVEIQLEEEGHNECENMKESCPGKPSAEKAVSHGQRKSTETKSSSATGRSVDNGTEPPESKKPKTGKSMTVYDVLVQHNIQTMCEKTSAQNYEQSLKRKLPKGPTPPLVHPSCASPPVVSNPDFDVLLDSPSPCDSSKLNTPEMRRQLLEDFTQCIQRDNSGNIPLHVAVLYENIQLVKRHCALLTARKSSLDVHNDDTETPLHMAVMLRNVEIVQVLLSFGAKVSVADSSGNTALHLAVLEGNEQVLNALLSYSKGELPLDTFNDEGLAPLHLCAQAGKMEEAKSLLHKGAEIDLKDAKSGRTPLFHAVERNAVNLVKAFLDLGANPNLPNFSGHTALLAANEYCDTSITVANEALFMTPKLRPLNAEDRPMVAALVGLSSDLDSQMLVEDENIINLADER